MNDVVLGLAMGYQWEQVRPFAHSLVRSGFKGAKVLFVRELSDEAELKLKELGFSLIQIPFINFSNPDIVNYRFFPYVGRFLLFSQFLRKYANEFRYAIFSDVRDVVFFKNPIDWLESRAQASKIVAAPENIFHKDQPGNSTWIQQGFLEVSNWMREQPVYCSGFISGSADYMRDLAMGIYLIGREMSSHVWGCDQPAYNSLIHQAAWYDVTMAPTLKDRYCVNLAVFAMPESRAALYDFPEGKNGVAKLDLREFCVVHQYDRFVDIARNFRETFEVLD